MTGPPRIGPVAPGTPRPQLSVAIPTWRPRLDHLERAVASVVAQVADGAADVELLLVDDASPDFDPHAFAVRNAPGRITVLRADLFSGSLPRTRRSFGAAVRFFRSRSESQAPWPPR